MAGFIQNTCTNCALCEPICPTNSVLMGFNHYVIDTDSCEECKLCASICPVQAIEIRPRKVANQASS